MTFGHHCKVRREGGRIIVEIPEDQLLEYFAGDPEFPTVGDQERFFPAFLPYLLDAKHPTGNDECITAFDYWLRRAAIATAMDGNGASLNPEESLDDGDRPFDRN